MNLAPQSSPDNNLTELELLQIKTARLEAECKVLHERDQEMRSQGEVAKQKLAHWERLKEETKAAHDEYVDSMEDLAALARGDAQTTIDDVEDDAQMKISDMPNKAIEPVTTARPVCGTLRAMTFNLTREAMDACELSCLRPTLQAEANKRKVTAVKALAGSLYLPIEQEILEDGSGYYNCVPLLERDEWDTRHAEEFGSSIRDLEEGQQIRGGDFAGLQVKHGRKVLVVGPDSEIVRLIFGADGGYCKDDELAARLMTKKVAS